MLYMSISGFVANAACGPKAHSDTAPEGFDEWLINFIHDEVGIPKYILRFVILPLLHKLKDGAHKLASDKIKEFFVNRIRRLVDTLLKDKKFRDKLFKAVHALAKKDPPSTFSKNITAGIQLTEIKDEIAQLRQWAEKENLEAASIIDQLSQVIATQMERKQPSLISPEIDYQSTDEPYSLDDINWLRPGASNGIPFICPEDKMKTLNEFANDDRQFSAWVVSGPSGSGKTRLAIEWMKRNRQRWWCGFTAKKPQGWENWAPVADTFIVVDYFNISHQVVQLIINRMMSLGSGIAQCDFKVRLLILDHNFSPSLENVFWKQVFNSGSLKEKFKTELLFDRNPIELRDTQDDSVIRGIIKTVAGEDADEQEIHKWFTRITTEFKGAAYPLFAALAGVSIRSKKKFAPISRRALVEIFLKEESRLPWEQNDEGQALHGRIAGGYVCFSTILNGLSTVDELRATLLEGEYRTPVNIDLAKFLISHKDGEDNLPAMLPDIMGETFVLKYFKAGEKDDRIKAKGDRIRSALYAKNEPASVASISEFIHRTSLNICDDIKEGNEIFYNTWKALLTVRLPERKKTCPYLYAHYSLIACNAFYMKKEAERAEDFSREISPAEVKSFAGRVPLNASLQWNLFNTYVSGNLKLIEKMMDAGIGVDQALTDDGTTALVAACLARHKEIVELLIDRKAKVNQATTDVGWTALMAACQAGHKGITELLISNGATVNQATTDDGWTALMAACQAGHKGITELLISNGAKVNQATTDKGTTALLKVCEKGYQGIAELLISNGAKVNQATTDVGWTALMAACQAGHKEIAEMLIDRKAKVNQATTDKGWTALMAACAAGHKEIAELLISHGAKVNQARTDNDWTALMVAGHKEIAELLISHGATVNQATTNNGWTALMAACEARHKEIAELLISHGATVNQATTDIGWTALMAACQEGHKEIAELLISHEATVNQATTDKGWTALMAACQAGHKGIAELLISHGAKVNQATTDMGWTALMMTCQAGHKEIAKLLIDRKAEVNQATTDQGWTALMATCQEGHKEIAELLISNGATVNQATKDNGATALLKACEKGYQGIAELLISHGAKVNQATTDVGWTALMAACLAGHKEIAELLIDRKATVNQATTDIGWTALMAACQAGHKEIAELLISHGATVNQATTDIGWTALMAACAAGHKEITELLIRHGATVNQARTDNGTTALMVAYEEGHKEIAELLISHGAREKH